jgi:hypothetical protein
VTQFITMNRTWSLCMELLWEGQVELNWLNLDSYEQKKFFWVKYWIEHLFLYMFCFLWEILWFIHFFCLPMSCGSVFDSLKSRLKKLGLNFIIRRRYGDDSDHNICEYAFGEPFPIFSLFLHSKPKRNIIMTFLFWKFQEISLPEEIKHSLKSLYQYD